MLNTSPPPRSGPDRNELFELGLPIVRRVAFRMARRLPPCVELDDLTSAGTEGLLRAAAAYDPMRNDRFEPYAECRIRGAMLDELRAADVMTRHGRSRMVEVSRCIARLEHELSRSPTEEEIAERLEIPLAQYHQIALELSHGPAIGRLGEHDPDDVATSVLDPSALFAEAELRGQLTKAVGGLPERTQQVLALYHQHECTQAEIGHILHVTESRVCQILGEAHARLRGKLAVAGAGPDYLASH